MSALAFVLVSMDHESCIISWPGSPASKTSDMSTIFAVGKSIATVDSPSRSVHRYTCGALVVSRRLDPEPIAVPGTGYMTL